MIKVDERKENLKKILNSFDVLKKLLKEKAICEDDRIIVFDPPFTIHILKRQGCMFLYHESEELGFVSLMGCKFSDREAEVVMDTWLEALTSLGFRRYSIKKR